LNKKRLVRWCTGAPVHWRTGALAHWRTGALVHWRTGALAHWRIGKTERKIFKGSGTKPYMRNSFHIKHFLFTMKNFPHDFALDPFKKFSKILGNFLCLV
jgi:hypothetical protein